jgi:16S rRNA (guanine1516-N2)-methyltransferase
MTSEREVLIQRCEKYFQEQGLKGFRLSTMADETFVVDPEGREFTINFDENKKDYRRKAVQGGQELIVKALAGEMKFKNVLDLSAGLGIDAVFLSQCGFQVTALERHPVLYFLLCQALEKTSRSDLAEMRILNFDSKKFLENLPADHFYQVAYFDPMYPDKKKSALPRKEMQIFRRLIGDDQDSKEVLALVLRKNFQRVVVKRPLKAEVLLPGVIHSFKGTTVRYDLYVQKF